MEQIAPFSILSLGSKFMEINYFRLSEKAKNTSPCDKRAIRVS